jgi:hypothetical protein
MLSRAPRRSKCKRLSKISGNGALSHTDLTNFILSSAFDAYSFIFLIFWGRCRDFKSKTKVDKVVVLWTANTERYSDVIVGLNDTKETLLASLERNESEISPSTLYGLACVQENVPFINGSPQNTFVPGQ